MAHQRCLYLFGDQTNDFVSGLRQLLRLKDDPLLASFFEKTHVALRHEITQQRRHVQELLPRFSSIVDLLSAYSTDLDSTPVLASTLTTIYQLGSFISYYGDGSRTYPSGAGHTLLGLCTGQLAASAVASASSAAELVSLGVEAVVIAFRTGLLVTKTRSLLSIDTDANKNWSFIVPKLQVDIATSRIERFSLQANLPIGSRPFIGNVGPSGVTICGHPRILHDLFSSPDMSDVKSLPAPIFAPYHEPNLYAETDIEEILGDLSEAVAKITPKLPVSSSVTGEIIPAENLRDLLHTALGEILREPLRLDRIVKSVESSCRTSSCARWVILTVGTNASQMLANALSEVEGTTVETRSGGRSEQSKIAIIGYSGRFPEAADPDSLWKILQDGRDVHREIPADRFNVDTHYDPSGKKKNTSQVRTGCFINEPGLFDCRFFNLSPKEADQSDPAQRLALLTAYEALEMAGVVPDRTPSTQRDRVGVFYGLTSDDWREVNSGQNVGTYFIPGGNRAFTPGRINYHFKFSGPSVSVDTACSSSAAAIHVACNSLWRNDCDTAIAGGTNVMTNPDNFTGLDKGHFLSRTGNCKTFDDGADGYCRADAVGTVILKRLEDALADKDPIQAVICGAYTNHSAEAESITRPHIGAQSAIFRRILNDAGHDPLDVSYIEMHGTGTQAGDAVEMRSVLDVFAGKRSSRSAEKPLYLGSVKANLGHAESASGVTSLIKVMMMMKNSEIPPHCGIKTKINSGFPKDLTERGIRIAMEATPWGQPADGGKRMAFLNNFSAAGGNSALLLEDAPTPFVPDVSEDPRSVHIVAVSARTANSISKNAARLVEHLTRNPNTSLASLAYTTTARRIHHNYRLSVTGSTLADVKASLEKAAAGLSNARPVSRKVPQVAFAFTGQGSVYQGMGKHLYASFGVFREELRRLDTIGQSFGFDSFMPLIQAHETETLHSPQASQLALTCVEIALTRLWESFGVVPSVVVGHSLGEYAALHIAGVLSARDVVFLVGTRARITQERCSIGTHAMLAVKAPLYALAEVLRNHNLEVACINGPSQTVLSGLATDIDAGQEALGKSGIKTSKLQTDFAFHSSQVEPVLDEFERLCQGVVFAKPKIPVISPLLESVITQDDDQLRIDYLLRHCRETVNLAGAVQEAVSQNVVSKDTIFLEIGPDPIVIGMIKAIIGTSTSTVASVRKSDGLWATMSNALSTLYTAGLDLQWGEFHRDFEAFQKVISLPAYQWDYKNHWIQYVHDWCLTKGDAPAATSEIPTATTAVASQFLSATCQKIISSKHETNKSSVVIESDISHPDLRAVFEAHKVNGAVLCPSSVYCDIAMTLGNYLQDGNPIESNRGIEVADMATTKPLLMRTPGQSEFFRTSAEADWISQTAKVVFYSVDSRGITAVEHATCTIRFGDQETWMSEWSRMAYLVKSRMQSLRDAAENSNCHLIKRGMAYKLFENCVEYGERFQGIDGVYLDSKGHEATAQVTFKDKSTCFHANPYYIDSLGHLSGFIMNATEAFDYKSQVFINHGWESIRCAVKLSAEETYHTYVQMQSLDGKKYIGDVYIFHGDTIIGVNRGVAFQAVSRKVLSILLPGPTTNTAAKTTNEASSIPKTYPNAPQKAISSKPANTQTINKAKESSAASRPDSVPESFQIVQAMNIIAEESGITITEMKNDLSFMDVGVDSLLSLTICGRFREELGLDVGSTLFLEYPTVRDIKMFLGATSSTTNNSTSEDDSSKSSTPASGLSGGEDASMTSQEMLDVEEEDKIDDQGMTSQDQSISKICAVLAEEIGVDVQDVWNAASLAELGLDSLLSLTVLCRLREDLGIDLPMDFFMDDDIPIQQKLLGVSGAPQAKIIGSVSQVSKPKSTLGNIPAASSVLLQGNLATANKILFLFPDGSGSATSYAMLPLVAPNVAVVGLNCPYMKRPQDLKCALQDLTTPYLDEIRRRQAHGPYYLGGWSAGGIAAYDAAATLMMNGEEIAALILLDSPNPIRLSKLPVRMYDFLNSAGMFGSGSKKPPPEWLMPHFLAFIDALDRYDPVPFKLGTAPFTHAIWAADGVYKSTGDKRLKEEPDDTREMKWLLHDRTDYGPNGWDQLVGTDMLRIEVLDGANHFTMMQGEQGRKLSQFLARSLGI
ncbi:conidial yellow pigment biosynthesis polyketide synthase [Trichoderma barbatum]